MNPQQMPDVLCLWCLEKGGLEVSWVLKARPAGNYSPVWSDLKFAVVQVPKLSCHLCKNEVMGWRDGPGHVAFPDPHA